MATSDVHRLVDATGLPLKKSGVRLRWLLPYGLVDLYKCPQVRAIGIRSIWIYTSQRKRGHGNRVMTALCGAADVLNLRLCLDAFAYGAKPKPTTDALAAWYGRHGFVPLPIPKYLEDSGRIPMLRRPQALVRRVALAA